MESIAERSIGTYAYEIEGKHYGEGPRTGRVKWGYLKTGAQNLAYFCPGCGRIWARIARAGEQNTPSDEEARWQALHVYCQRCGGNGSIFHSYDDDLIDLLPRPALEREFLIALESENWPFIWGKG